MRIPWNVILHVINRLVSVHEPLPVNVGQHAQGMLQHLACFFGGEGTDGNHLRQTFVGALHHQINERRIARFRSAHGEYSQQIAMR